MSAAVYALMPGARSRAVLDPVFIDIENNCLSILSVAILRREDPSTRRDV